MLVTTAADLGVNYKNYDVRLVNSSGGDILRGQLLKLDFERTVASNIIPSDPNSVFSNGVATTRAVVIDATTISGGETFGHFAVALEAIASGQRGRFRISGIVNALISSSAGLSAGSPLQPSQNAGQKALQSGDDGVNQGLCKILGILLEDVATGNQYGDVLFDGIHGFGFANYSAV